MTREEALEELDTLLIPRDGEQDKLADAFEMAIKALSQQTEDAISRQAVINAIANTCFWISANDWNELVECIESIPSVNPQEPSDISNDGTLTVNVEDGRKISRVLVCGANHWGGLYYPDEQEPKTGHWIYKTMEGQFCSICDEQSVWKFNYCPNCGAKMEEQA